MSGGNDTTPHVMFSKGNLKCFATLGGLLATLGGLLEV